MIILESGGMSHSKKITYSNSKIPIPQNERKQTGPKIHPNKGHVETENILTTFDDISFL
jgi:hypothetical protein